MLRGLDVHVHQEVICLNITHWIQSLSVHISQETHSIHEEIWHVLLFKYNDLTRVDDQVPNFLSPNFFSFSFFWETTSQLLVVDVFAVDQKFPLTCKVDLMFMFTKKLYILVHHIEFNLFRAIFSKKGVPFMNKFDMFYFLNITTWLESMIKSPTFYP